MVRKGTTRANIAGERYDSNAIQANAGYAGRQNMNANDLNMQSMAEEMGGMQGMMEMMQNSGMMGMNGNRDYISGKTPIACYYNLDRNTPIDHSFITIYPNYINNKKTIAQGRRIPKELACEDPIAGELSEICAFHNLPHVLETLKQYSRDWMVMGRVKVRLQKANGEWENSRIQSRKDLMKEMGSLIPKLKSREMRLEMEAQEALKASTQAATNSSSGSATYSSSKKKGKKKGRR